MATTTTTVLAEPAATELQTLQVESAFNPSESSNVVVAKQKWNEPGINKYRLAATFASFAVVGASDGVYGVCKCLSSAMCEANE